MSSDSFEHIRCSLLAALATIKMPQSSPAPSSLRVKLKHQVSALIRLVPHQWRVTQAIQVLLTTMISGIPTIWAILAVITLLPSFVALAAAAADAPSSCEYSCPGKNQNEWELWNTPTALGWDSAYSIFECVYSTIENHKQSKHTCSYYKTNGKQALGYAGDACPPQAIQCSTVETPLFSTQGKYETPPWVEHGRDLAYLMGHPIAG